MRLIVKGKWNGERGDGETDGDEEKPGMVRLMVKGEEGDEGEITGEKNDGDGSKEGDDEVDGEGEKKKVMRG